MNILEIIKDRLIGKRLIVYTNSKMLQNTCPVESVFNYTKDFYYDKEIEVTITNVETDSGGSYDDYAEYVVIYFTFNSKQESICFTATNLDTELQIS